MKTEKWIAIEVNGEIRVTRRENFETISKCEIYDNYGHKIGCFNAGCYSFDNSDSYINQHFIKALEEKSGLSNLADYKTEIIDYIFGDEDEKPEILSILSDKYIFDFAEKWRTNNEAHEECVAWTYHDGSNFKTVIIESDFQEINAVELSEEFVEYLRRKNLRISTIKSLLGLAIGVLRKAQKAGV